MNRTELVAGLDIGTTKVCMVIAEAQPDGRLEIIGEGLEPSTGLQKGVVVDIDSTANAVKQAAEKAQRVAGAQVSSVFVGVSGEHISSMNSKGIVAVSGPHRQVRMEDVDRAIDSARVVVLPPDREIIHAIPRGFAIDGQDGIKSPVGMSGSRLEVETHIVHGVSSFLQNLAKSVDKAGFSIEGLVLQSFAGATAVLGEAEKSLGVVLVDIGGGTTDVAVYVNGSIAYSGIIPVGGNNVTQDIAVGLQCPLSEAERLKVKFGASMVEAKNGADTFAFQRIGSDQESKLPTQLLLEIIEPRMTEIFQLVDRLLDRSGVRKSLPAGIVLTGGASLLRGASALGEKVLGMPTRLGKAQRLSGIAESVSSPVYATAVGLAAYGAGQIMSSASQPRSGKGVAGIFAKLKDVLMGSEP